MKNAMAGGALAGRLTGSQLSNIPEAGGMGQPAYSEQVDADEILRSFWSEVSWYRFANPEEA